MITKTGKILHTLLSPSHDLLVLLVQLASIIKINSFVTIQQQKNYIIEAITCTQNNL